MENQTELIEGYLRGTLSAKENELVENLLESDEEFRQELELHRLGEELVLDSHLLELKKELSGIMDNNGGSGWKKSYTIATVLVFITGGIFLFQSFNSPENEKPAAVNKLVNAQAAEPVTINEPADDSGIRTTQTGRQKSAAENTTAGNQINSESLQEKVSTPVPSSAVPQPAVTNHASNNQQPQNVNADLNDPTDVKATNTPCKLPDFKADKTDACRDTETGRIVVISADTRNYNYALNQGEFSNEPIFEGLAEGSYLISVKDDKNCIATREVMIKSRRCISDFALIPSVGDVWNLPVPDYGRLKVNIFSKTGQQVFAAEMRQGESKSWNGRASDGAPLPMGGYAAIIENEDGSVTTVTITIVE